MMAFGWILQVVVLRRMIGEPVISVIMVTIGLSIFFQALMKWMFGVSVQPFPTIFAIPSVDVLGTKVQTIYVMSTLVSIAVMSGFAWFFKFSRMGLAMRATAFDQQVAQSLGVSVRQVFAVSWGISAMVSALAGVVIGAVNGVSSALSFFGIKVFPAAILGGLDSIVGAVVGGLAVALAIRPTLENIMGGFLLFADKPVRLGEFCSFGDKMGTVEQIGLRSTRIRGLDRTVITVPNAEFAQMQIVNFTRRDMNLCQ
jgi:branched-subunit amino acid ABC-type transport system permease component